MKALAITILLLTPIAHVHSQISNFEKGKSHYDKREFREALYFFNKSIKDSVGVLTYKFRGNCFFELNVLDSAEADYRTALTLSPRPELYYNLGTLFLAKNDPVSAEPFLRKFVQIKPEDTDGLYYLFSSLKRNGNDSSLIYLQRAYSYDTLNEAFYIDLAYEHFARNHYLVAQKMAKASRTKFPLTNSLLPLEAYTAFTLGEFSECSRICDSLIVRQSSEIEFYILRAKADILKNTDREKYVQKGFTFRLTEYSSNSKDIDSWISDPSHPYFYPKLLKKFKSDPASMSLPEFFMVYYGYTTDDGYHPYSHGSSAMLSSITEETTDDESISIYRKVVDAEPFSLGVYERLATAYFATKDIREFESAGRQYLGLMEALLATGNGKSADSAYFVVAPSHEYQILSYMGLRSTMQSLRHVNGHSYDVLHAQDENGQKQEVFFNIDKPWQSLSSSVSGNGGKKKPKKKKKT